MKVVVVGGVAGGCLDGRAAQAARRDRRDRRARARPLRLVRQLRPAVPHRRRHRGPRQLLLQTPESLRRELRARRPDRAGGVRIDRDAKDGGGRDGDRPRVPGVLRRARARPGAAPFRPPMPGVDHPARRRAAQHPRHGSRSSTCSTRTRQSPWSSAAATSAWRWSRRCVHRGHGGHARRGARPGHGRARPRDGPPARGPPRGPRHPRAALEHGASASPTHGRVVVDLGDEQITTDLVILAVGVRPETTLAKAAGLGSASAAPSSSTSRCARRTPASSPSATRSRSPTS